MVDPTLHPTDPLGRRVLSNGQAKNAIKLASQGKSGVIYRVSVEDNAAESLSVDQLDIVPDREIAAMADQMAKSRGPDRSFYGWAVVTVRDATRMGWRVETTPQPDNDYHADIFLNLPQGEERRDLAVQHALDLALNSIYRPRPNAGAP